MKINYMLLLLLVITALSAKEIGVKETRQLYGNLDQPAFFPTYSVDGTSIHFTGNAYTGLWILDRSNLQLSKITDLQGAGFNPISLSDGSIVFRQDEYIRGRKYTSLLKSDRHGIQRLVDKQRFLSTTNAFDDQIITLVGEDLVLLDGIGGNRVNSLAGISILINDNLSLKTLRDGVLGNLEPLGSGNYIWGVLSPLKDLLVFTKVGQGTYVCDLEGKLITDLGTAHVPQWSPDGHFLVFMKDLDDGHQYTESEIWIASVDGSQTWQITHTPDRIEMYPQWSPAGDHIVYHSHQGEIFETAISITD